MSIKLNKPKMKNPIPKQALILKTNNNNALHTLYKAVILLTC